MSPDYSAPHTNTQSIVKSPTQPNGIPRKTPHSLQLDLISHG
ncbi:uncharacterized protein RCO7_14593 [Rhynchosporium graminicola]|uniref:Uncharacterized protein n=2 Tax=Rhynchosporium TaxID=38037 RepID=A0A1E1MLR6_RHYSE|nr:uncharacterized protein RCO7_14593 [Rhynchosporium commune]CZT50022.1 uncharacterized protein RSE6_10940 [Rhynchosporium secalis]